MTVLLSPVGGVAAQFFDDNGVPLSGGKIYTYLAGSTTPQTTYTSSSGSVQHANPIILDAAGRVSSGEIWLTDGVQYKFTIKNSADVQIGVYDNITGVNSAVNASQVAYTAPLSGATATNVQAKLVQTVSVKDFGATGDGITDDTVAIQNAINAVSALGGTVYIPAGTYVCSATINLAKFVYIRGAGIRATTLKWATTGDGILMSSPINTSTPVNTGVYDINLQCTNGANTGGGYVDVCGTYVYLERVRVIGFKYGIIFDQTELGDIYLCELQQQITAGVWLVNGSDHTPLASSNYTNRISIKSSQFNQPATAYCIVDDGGYAHTFDANNFNGGLSHIRNAGQLNVNISNSEFESAAGASVVWTNTTLKSGTAVGQSVDIVFQNNLIIPTVGQYCLNMSNGSPLIAIGNYFGNSATAKINGLTNVNQFVDIGNISGGGPYSIGSPTINFALSSGSFTPEITFDTPGDLSVTYSTQIGRYQRFGNAVTVEIVLITSTFTWSTSSGYLRISGLPFAANSLSNFNQGLALRYQGITKAGYTQFTPTVLYGQTYMYIAASASASSTTSIQASEVPSGGSVILQISGTYLT